MIKGITNKDVQALIKIYEEAEKEIINKIAKADFLNRGEKEKTLKQIQNILSSLYSPTQKFITSKSKKEYQSGIQEVQQSLAKLNLKGSFNLINPKAAQFVMENLKDIQDGALSDIKLTLSNSYLNIQNSLNLVIKNVKNSLASDVANNLVSKIAKGQILGNPRKEISRQLAMYLDDQGITAFHYTTKNGDKRKLSLPAYVEGLTRSTLINSRASAVVQQCLEMGHDLVKIDKHLNESPMCSKWGGKILSISGNTPGYPTLSEGLFNGDYKRGGIFHRFCRHSLTVYIPTDIRFD